MTSNQTGPAWPADSVERWPVEKLIPSARNARTHSDAQVAQLAASMREWGWTMPILVDEDGELIAGHGRVLAARQLGYATVPTMVARGWTEAQKRAYMLADNRLPLNAGWDDAMLSIEMTDLQAGGFDLGLIGFSPEEQSAILSGWESDYKPNEKDGEHLDGIDAKVIVVVAPDDADSVREVIENALAAAGIEGVVK